VTGANVLAVNPAVESDNRIHADDVARRYGFRGGLVPGVTVHAYLARLPAARWGRAWVERGTMTVRLLKPVYEGDVIALAMDDGGALEAVNADGVVCAAGTTTRPDEPGPRPVIAAYPTAPLPTERVPPTPDGLDRLDRLGSLEWGFHAEHAPDFLTMVDDELPLWRDEAVAHPGWLVQWANWVFAANVALGPWIHVSSDVTHHSAAVDGDRLSIRGRVASRFEKGGHCFAQLDLLIVANDERPVMRVLHTAIYRIREPG